MKFEPARNALPIGTQSFEILRSENNVYVDKTEHIYNLITGSRVYFLSRPRRFGKSLLISTLEALFRGKHELFVDTWIHDTEYDWPVHPIIRIDMTRANRQSVEAFNASLIKRLAQTAKTYQLELEPTTDPSEALDDLIIALEDNLGKVVVLIDEYDKPILDNITKPPLAEAMCDTLRQFYGILKAQDENLRFVMLTGITKFSIVSVFSGLNNLQDISGTEKYTTLCGYTQTELEQNFQAWIERLAKTEGATISDELAKIKHWYYGYQFSEFGERVYNPFSTLVLFEHQAYKPYWFDTGTPKFLFDVIKEQGFALQGLDHLIVRGGDLTIQDVSSIDAIPLLYQTGYLTIQHYDKASRNYTLGYPNFEVNESFSEGLFSYFSQTNPQDRKSLIDSLIFSLQHEQYGHMLSIVQTFFAGVSYHLQTPKESYYQSLFYLIFRLVGIRISAESQSNLGRADAIIEIDDRVLIFEFKLDRGAIAALQQVHDKKYYQPYQNQGKEIILFGVNFSKAERNITEWQQETIYAP